ncbi:MAG: periplasmic protein TonB [Hydrocarboniphaga sp.]|uniref:energy transducer TonB n=1 Tax=Hydrocarboniphaga sp. TaxID=2033016 RepID=UPI00260EDB5A|nr:energy transducer TonB [Hydrocarboniphaga sp.]MDB5973180.1 periplasmic protein TonB [Hydrocarboniphaga sp.]
MQSVTSSRNRLLPAALAGLTFSALMFLMLYGLISRHGGGIDKADTLPTIDFVRLKRDTELQTLERRKPPPPPPPPKTPPPPKLKVSSETPPEQQTPFAMPNLGLSASVGGGPFLGALGSVGGAPAGGMFDGDIIPLQRIAPTCPRQAQLDGLTGTITLDILVNADGTVRAAKVLQAKPRGIFDSAAISSVQRWKFKPRVVDGKPVEQHGTQVMNFNCGGE